MAGFALSLEQAPTRTMEDPRRFQALSKVPEVTVLFWIVKILATTLGETGGDSFSMTLNLGYAVSTGIFFVFFAVMVFFQIRARRFHAFLYWLTIVATTLAGTTMADFADRSAGIGYMGGSLVLLALVLGTLLVWRAVCGTVSVDSVRSPRVETFYWLTILFSNTLGTALGDWVADAGPGFEGGALIFAGMLVVVAALYKFTSVPRTVLFWSAFILTRPLGATVGDMLTKPHANGGLALGRFASSGVLAAAIVLLLVLLPQRAGDHPGAHNEG
jgi:uncharacterized membrane-anchored protein